MHEKPITIIPYRDVYREQVIAVWERSVRATHHFLHPADITYYKTLVDTIDFNCFPVYCLVSEDVVIGFMGVAGKKIEMLFLSPDCIGEGLGKRLLNFAIATLHADSVDVNEQNVAAVNFYRRFGFETEERTETDSEGKEYPVLKMKRTGR